MRQTDGGGRTGGESSGLGREPRRPNQWHCEPERFRWWPVTAVRSGQNRGYWRVSRAADERGDDEIEGSRNKFSKKTTK